MAKRKKRGKKAAGIAPHKEQPRGFDYGCLPYALAIGLYDFPSQLTAASVDGIAYGLAWSETIQQSVPTITLVGQERDGLAKAFKTFNDWSELTDPDSVELTFVFRKSGGYALVISPECSRLERRCLGFDRSHKSTAFLITWIKQMDSTNPFLAEFRAYCASPIAPFYFEGAVYDSRDAFTASSPPDLIQISDLQPLLKFEVSFLDEDDVRPGTIGWSALNIHDRPSRKTAEEMHKPDPEEIARFRAATLQRHFPATLERIRRSPAIPRLLDDFRSDGVRPWQIEQALCNLVLSASMGRPPHFLGLSARKLKTRILEELRSRCELANGVELPAFDEHTVRAQIVADGNELLRHLRSRIAIDLGALQEALRSLRVLEVSGAIKDPPTDWTKTP